MSLQVELSLREQKIVIHLAGLYSGQIREPDLDPAPIFFKSLDQDSNPTWTWKHANKQIRMLL